MAAEVDVGAVWVESFSEGSDPEGTTHAHMNDAFTEYHKYCD